MRTASRLLLLALLFSYACGGGGGGTNSSSSGANSSSSAPTISAAATGAAIAAASCSDSDVQSAINAAAPGDVVNIPAGTCTWSSGITIQKSISLIGAGQGATVINDNYAGGNLINIGSWTPIAPRVSGMTINAGTSKKASMDGEIVISKVSADPGFRVDHITINGIRGIGMVTWDWVKGVIDHCTFNSVEGSNWSLLFNGDAWGGQAYRYGDKAWNDPDDFGTNNFVFVENSTFNNAASYPINFADSYGGARYVLRYNRFNNGFLRAHGTDSTPGRRGTRAVEIYNNTFVNNLTHIAEALEFRSGTAVFYNNTASGIGGVDNGIALKCFRDNGNYWAGWGRCNGSSPFDQNGAEIACLDQPGRGQGALMTSGSNPQPRTWPNQALSPAYIWGNTGFKFSQGSSTSGRVQQNREFYLDMPKPGYAAYPYPHPLAAS